MNSLFSAFAGILSILSPAAMALAASMDLLTSDDPELASVRFSAIGFFVLAGLLDFPLHGVLVNLSCGAAVSGVDVRSFCAGPDRRR